MFKWYKKLKFSSKLLLLFSMVITIPIVSLTVFEDYYSRMILEDKTNDYLQSISSVTMSKIESTVLDTEDMAFYINGNSTIQESLSKEPYLIESREGYYQLYNDIRSIITSYALQRQEIAGISIFSESGKRYSISKSRSGTVLDTPEYNSRKKQYWSVANQRILLHKKIFKYPTQENLGYLIIELREKKLYDIISDIDYAETGDVFIVNENGTIVSTKNKDLISTSLETELMKCFKGDNSFYPDVNRNGLSYSVYCSDEISNGWSMVLAIPRDYYEKDISNLQKINIIIAMLVIVVAVLVAIRLSKSVTKPINKLSSAMEEFGQGNFMINCDVDSEDEIGLLSNTFNKMVDDMNSMVVTVYEQKVMQQEAEMKSLQMQINPHFLYNTLDTINWIARLREVDEIGDMVSSLGNLMRYSLDTRAFVKLSEEVKNLKDYIDIQKVRYGDDIDCTLNIPESLGEFYIPKLLIQPIVENAIVHGLEDKLEKGHVSITAVLENGDLFITIEDDGVGMTEGTIGKILGEDYSASKKGHTSIGIVNVHKRIQMIYGCDYGLGVQSELGHGTKMILHIRCDEIPPKI